MCLLLSAGESIAEERTVTIYFCGTGATSEWYNGSKSAWHTPELIAELYQNDDSYPITKKSYIAGIVYEIESEAGHPHYKYIVDGIGTDFFSLLGQIDPDFGVRGWNVCENEAVMAVDLIAEAHPDDNIILNLIGWSRGGILTMKTARRLANDVRISKINMLAYDPVPGGFDPIGKFGDDLKLPANVNQYVGIYALDERTYVFEPVIPAKDADSTKMWLVAVPGSHETMMGNFQLDGHSKTPIDPFGIIDWTVTDGMKPVNHVARIVADQLLTSWEWGEVLLKDSSPYSNKADFLQQVSAMYDYDYWFVRGVSFLPGWSTYDGCYWLTGRDHQLRIYWALPVIHGRLCFVAPYRHTAEWAWSCAPWPVWFPNTDQVYWMEGQVTPMNGTAWDTLQSFRGSPPPDTTPPVPTVDPLPPITGECSVTITAPPTATDNVSGTVTGTTTDPLTYTQQGTYTITWTYTDGSGNTSTQTQTVVVDDSTPPTPDVEELPVIQGQCSAQITSTPTATDNCSGQIIGTTGDPLSYSEQGTYTVTWTYDDGNGNTATQTQTVIVKDTIPPVIKNLTASPNVLWPANHKMARVTVNASASDNCGGNPVCRITSVSSNEPVNGLGDGDTAPDWEIIGKLALKLRAERSGKGSGRIYTISVMCADVVGNSSTGEVSVSVPHDQGNKNKKGKQ